MKKHFRRIVFAFSLCLVLLISSASAFNFADAISGQYWNQFVDSILMKPGATSQDQMMIYKNKINAWDWAHAYWGANTGYVDIVPDKENGCMRLQDTYDGRWITLPDGTYPFYPVSGDVPDTAGANTPAPPSISRNKFTDARSIKNPSIVVSYNVLSEACVKINDEGIPCSIKLITNMNVI